MGSKRVWGCSESSASGLPAEPPFPPVTTTAAASAVPPSPWGEWSNNISHAKRHCASAPGAAAGPAAPQCWLPPQPQQHPFAHVSQHPACGAAAVVTPPPAPSAGGRKRKLSETLECLESVLGQLHDAQQQQQQAPAQQQQFAPQRGPPAKRRRLRANIEVQESVAAPGFVDVYIDPAYIRMLLPQFPHLIAYHHVPSAMPSASLPPQRVRFTLSAGRGWWHRQRQVCRDKG